MSQLEDNTKGEGLLARAGTTVIAHPGDEQKIFVYQLDTDTKFPFRYWKSSQVLIDFYAPNGVAMIELRGTLDKKTWVYLIRNQDLERY
jgi:translation initiation factor 2B subunit (eIF-2B alpha/beta/delta family)